MTRERSPRRGRWGEIGAALCIFATWAPLSALAQAPGPNADAKAPPPPTPVGIATLPTAPTSADDKPQPTEDDKKEAKRLYEKGVDLYREDAISAAFSAFARSRELYPTRGNTYNAARCLRKLQRFDEALDMFEALLRDFPNLPAEDKHEAQMAVAELRDLVGTVEITGAEVGAGIVIDGQSKGDYPPITPIRVSIGQHVVRVVKEGYEPYETPVEVKGGQTSRVAAKLTKLSSVGRLKVVEQSGRNLDVLLDGSPVGQTPWEGTVGVGTHLVILRGKGKTGTPPVGVDIKSEKPNILQLRGVELEASLRIDPSPLSAKVILDGATLGSGPWAGRMPVGKHRVEIADEGYVRFTKEVDLEPGEVEKVAHTLERDKRSDRWRPPTRWPIEVAMGPVMTSLGGDLGASCGAGCSATLGAGGRVVVRAGYEPDWALGLFGFGIEAGYLATYQSITQRDASAVPNGLDPRPGKADDALLFHGSSFGASAWFRNEGKLVFSARLGLGGFFGWLRDDRAGSFTVRTGESVTAPSFGQIANLKYAYAEPEISLGLKIQDKVELSLAASVLVLYAPKEPSWNDMQSFSLGTDGVTTYPAEKLTGQVVPMFTPALRLRYLP